MLIGDTEQVKQAGEIVLALDVPVSEIHSPFHFYRLKHTTASEVLETLRALEGGQNGLGILSIGDVFAHEATIQPPESADNPQAPDSSDIADKPNTPDTPQTSKPETPPYYDRPNDDKVDEGVYQALTNATPRVVADVHTNSIIVIGPPDVQRIYADLIERLDTRRPQVLVEITLVSLDTSDGYSLGVELSQSDGISGGGDVITFSSFGLGTVDATTGALTLTPGVGFNGTIVGTDIADIVINALKRTGRAKVISSPKVLINDNEQGQLASTTQEPYESVNASSTVATTSFGGFAEAGTTISLTPHISEGDFLRLEYSIELSSFSGERVENLPPPKQQNKLSSSATIPDGDTIIVGGLRRADWNETVRAVPVLGEIPLMKYLFSDRSVDESESTLFVFIRPVILRDDTFADLKYLSQQDVVSAHHRSDLPSSEPMAVY